MGRRLAGGGIFSPVPMDNHPPLTNPGSLTLSPQNENRRPLSAITPKNIQSIAALVDAE